MCRFARLAGVATALLTLVLAGSGIAAAEDRPPGGFALLLIGNDHPVLGEDDGVEIAAAVTSILDLNIHISG